MIFKTWFLYRKKKSKIVDVVIVNDRVHKKELSWTKKTMIVDVVVVNSVVWAKGWGRGERGNSQRMGRSYLCSMVPEWMGFATMSKKLAFQVSRGFV